MHVCVCVCVGSVENHVCCRLQAWMKNLNNNDDGEYDQFECDWVGPRSEAMNHLVEQHDTIWYPSPEDDSDHILTGMHHITDLRDSIKNDPSQTDLSHEDGGSLKVSLPIDRLLACRQFEGSVAFHMIILDHDMLLILTLGDDGKSLSIAVAVSDSSSPMANSRVWINNPLNDSLRSDGNRSMMVMQLPNREEDAINSDVDLMHTVTTDDFEFFNAHEKVPLSQYYLYIITNGIIDQMID